MWLPVWRGRRAEGEVQKLCVWRDCSSWPARKAFPQLAVSQGDTPCLGKPSGSGQLPAPRRKFPRRLLKAGANFLFNGDGSLRLCSVFFWSARREEGIGNNTEGPPRADGAGPMPTDQRPLASAHETNMRAEKFCGIDDGEFGIRTVLVARAVARLLAGLWLKTDGGGFR